MAYYMAHSYLNLYWLIIDKLVWHLPHGGVLLNAFPYYKIAIGAKFLRGICGPVMP